MTPTHRQKQLFNAVVSSARPPSEARDPSLQYLRSFLPYEGRHCLFQSVSAVSAREKAGTKIAEFPNAPSGRNEGFCQSYLGVAIHLATLYPRNTLKNIDQQHDDQFNSNDSQARLEAVFHNCWCVLPSCAANVAYLTEMYLRVLLI